MKPTISKHNYQKNAFTGRTEGKGLCGIFLYTVWIYCYNWLNKEADWPIDGQDKVRGRATQRILGRRRAEAGLASRRREKQDGHAVLRKGTKPCGEA